MQIIVNYGEAYLRGLAAAVQFSSATAGLGWARFFYLMQASAQHNTEFPPVADVYNIP